MPLSLSNYWKYESIHYDSDGTINAHDTDLFIITNEVTYGQEIWYRMSPVWVTNREDGLWCQDTVVALLYKYPASVGDQYSCASCSYYIKVHLIDTTVSCDLGAFYCYSYKTVYQCGVTVYT